MSNQALVGTGGGGPQWQVDIPGLSQLIVSVGSYGLKQLALSGVDIHTIGCMLMIAEFTPASPDFRKTLSKARESQRNERLWMYKIVEIGAATNFFADQLLKTRAGENVIALLSAITPVMTEDACVALLSTLFDISGASLDNIPGRTQLLNIRKSLASLARKAGIGEQVLHHHHFLKQLLPDPQPSIANPPSDDAYQSIPDAMEIPHVIKLLHRLVTSTEEHILVVHGIRGAAWIVIYATRVLGLQACAVNHEGRPVPITSSYEDANVVVDLDPTNESKCGLYSKGELQELIRFDNSKNFEERGWSVDCSVINFVDLHHPELRQKDEFLRISTFVAIEAFNAIAQAVSFFEEWTPDATWYRNDKELRPLRFKTYAESVLPLLNFRGMKILRILGYLPPVSGYKFFENNQLFSTSVECKGHDTDAETTTITVEYGGDEHIEEGIFGMRIRKGEAVKKEIKQHFGQYIKNYAILYDDAYTRQAQASQSSDHHSDTQHMKDLQNYLADPKDPYGGFWQWPAATRRAISETARTAAHFVSRMVFTDWGNSMKLIAVNAMSNKNDVDQESDRSFEGLTAEAISLCFDSVNTKTIEKRFWSDDWLALDLDGLVAVRNAAKTASFDELNGMFLGLRPGTIEYEGNKYSRVRTDRALIKTVNYKIRTDEQAVDFPCVTLRNSFKSTRIRPLATASGDTVFLRTEVYLDSQPPIIVDGSLIAKNLSNLLITTPCPHGQDCTTNLGTDQKKYIGQFHQGLFFDDDRQRGAVVGNRISGSPVYVQQTKDNFLLQWIALQWMPENESERCLRVFQNGCCLSCILNRLGAIVGSINGSSAPLIASGYPICIIVGNGMKPKAPMVTPNSVSSIPSSLPATIQKTVRSNNQQHFKGSHEIQNEPGDTSSYPIRRKPLSPT